MKIKIAVLAISLFVVQISMAEDFAKLSREERCKMSGGFVASHGTIKTTVSQFGPIDCTCGGKRFNPIREGDTCKEGKIITALEHYCELSGGVISSSTTEGMKSDNAKPWPLHLKKCICGTEEFNPTKTSHCKDGKVSE